MTAKLLFKTLFLVILLFMLVLIGMNNKDTVSFSLPPILKSRVTQPAAVMYYAFFAVGILSGVILGAGGGGGKKSPSKDSGSKSNK